MKTVTDPTAYMIVRTFSGGKRENLKIFLNEDDARIFAGKNIQSGSFIHLESCIINGQFVTNDIGRVVG